MLYGESPLLTDAITNQIRICSSTMCNQYVSLERTKFRAVTSKMNLLKSYNTTTKINTIQNANARDLLHRVLSPYPDQRIGSDENPDIRSHPFFDSTDWHQIRVAILPKIKILFLESQQNLWNLIRIHGSQ